MSDREKELADELVKKYLPHTRHSNYGAKQCAKIDLNNRIELLNDIIDLVSDSSIIAIKIKKEELENQLTHLNNL